MIVTEGGKNVYPEDIEAAFAGLDDCEEYAVFASNYLWPSGQLGHGHEQLLIVVRPKPGTDEAARAALLDELRARNRRLADYKRLHGYLLWEPEFPRTASQKVKREPLARELRAKVDRDAVRGL